MVSTAFTLVVCVLAGCGRVSFDAVAGIGTVDSNIDAVGGDIGPPVAPCLGSAAGPVVFADDFADFAQWTPRAGAWSTMAGEAMQSDTSALLSYAAVNGLALGDVRAVTRMRLTGGSDTNRAIEIALRVAPLPSHASYHCNWESNTGGLLLQKTTASGAADASFVEKYTDVAAIAGYSADMAVTMEFEVVGDRLACCVREIPGAMLTFVDSTLTTGSAGLRTYLSSGSFDDFTVYGP